MKILVRTPFGYNSGFGRDGIGLVKALMKRGHFVNLTDTYVHPPLPTLISDTLRYPVGDNYDLELHHINPAGAMFPFGEESRSKLKVLWSMWEWDTIPENENLEAMQANIPYYDKVVCYTQQTQEVFQKYNLLPEESLILQGGIETDLWSPITESGDLAMENHTPRRFALDTPFQFAMVGMLSMRKNALTVIRAYGELREELGDGFNAELILKTGYPVLPPGLHLPGVKWVNNINMSNQELKEFYWSIDSLINVSWGEGKDLPSMEAALCGTPIIINDNPGHKMWNHPGIWDMLPSTQMPMMGGYEGYFTDVETVKSGMLSAYRNRVPRFQKVENLRSYILRKMDWGTKIEALGKALGYPL